MKCVDRKLSALLLLIGLAIFSPPASAQETAGIGALTCSRLLSIYETLEGAEQQEFYVAIHQWAYGFFTGQNRQLRDNRRRDLRALTVETTADEILSLCRMDPSARVWRKADVLFQRLAYVSPGV
ncbi:MAG: hypothetical protein AAF850_07910 [Pseudomonadota bacterium]